MCRSLLFLAIVAIVVAGHQAAFSTPRDGTGESLTIVDGDTLQVGGEVIQLYGIDAPELGQMCDRDGELQPCGVEAALALRKMITLSASSFHCLPWGDGADRSEAPPVRVCEVGHEDVGLVMLHGGYSVALPGSFPGYIEAQEVARQAGLGVWHSDFVMPWQWRQDQAANDRAGASTRSCNVKGVFDDRGERIYYVPTDDGYDGIVVDQSRGDRMFCSDDEARLTGWRRPGEMHHG
jgi:endonuclease YncB( thermonuclease family)